MLMLCKRPPEGVELHRFENCHPDPISTIVMRSDARSAQVEFLVVAGGAMAVYGLWEGTLQKASTRSKRSVSIRPIWQENKFASLRCQSADFQKSRGLMISQRVVLSQRGARNLEEQRCLTIARKDNDMSGVQVKRLDEEEVNFCSSAVCNEFSCDIIKTVNGRLSTGHIGKEAERFLRDLHTVSQAQCDALQIELQTNVVPRKLHLALEPPSCCVEMRPYLQNLVQTLSPHGHKLLQLSMDSSSGAHADSDLFDAASVPVAKHQDFNPSETSSAVVASILKCGALGMPLLIEGDASTGKTLAVEFAAHLMSKRLLKLPVSPGTSLHDMLGNIGFSEDTGGMEFKPGVLPLAMSRGYWLLLDEANLAPSSAMSALEEVLNTGQLEIPSSLVHADVRLKHKISSRGTLVVKKHPGFCVFATQNPPRASQYRATRHELSESLLSHFICTVMKSSSRMEIEALVSRRLGYQEAPHLDARKTLPEEGHVKLLTTEGALTIIGSSGLWTFLFS
eukprot:Skav204120  [mRNA]  locus=scaffold5190:228195:230377:- [translate_table: standard]